MFIYVRARRWVVIVAVLSAMAGNSTIARLAEPASVTAQASTANESVVVLVHTGTQLYPVVQTLYPLASADFGRAVQWAKLTPSVVLRTSDPQAAAKARSALQAAGANVEIDPFYMTVEQISLQPGRGTLIEGTVGRGTIQLQDRVELVGGRAVPIATFVTGMGRVGNAQLPLSPGDRVRLTLGQIKNPNEIKIGMLLVKAGTLAARTQFQAEVYVTTIAEGGQGKALARNSQAQFRLWNVDYTGTLQLSNGPTNALPGEVNSVTVALTSPAPVENGTWFTIYQQNRPIGFGLVTALMK